MSLLNLRNVSKRINNKYIVKDINFTLNKGEILGFLGPNGAGKTTTIKSIVGLLHLTEGDIVINNSSILEEPEKAKSALGAIVDNPASYANMSGYDNLKQTLRLYNSIDENRIKEVINTVGLTNRIHDKVKEYSLGMKQRLGLAQALLPRPKVLILDEPTNGLDPDGIKEMRKTLRRLVNEDDIGVLVSSHLLSEMELMCDRVTIIRNGQIVANKQLDEIEETSIYKLNTTNNVLAQNILNNDIMLKADENEITLECSEKEIQTSIRDIIENDIDINLVNKEKRSLEDYFVSATNSNQEGGQVNDQTAN